LISAGGNSKAKKKNKEQKELLVKDKAEAIEHMAL